MPLDTRGARQAVTMHATGDFETKSAAGFYWDASRNKWAGPAGAPQGKKGLPVIGAAAYAEHPSTDVLTFSYTLPGERRRRWRPGQPNPQELFDHLAAGGRFEAHNVMFERLIWALVCVPRYGWPPLPADQLDCSMATARVNSYPSGLADLGDVLRVNVRKIADGRRLLAKFSVPRQPTKRDPRVWITPDEEPADAENLYGYCDGDVASEQEASGLMPPMSSAEREFWLVDQEINWRGLAVDRKNVRDCIAVLDQALDRYGDEMTALTGGIKPTQLDQLKGWLAAKGVHTASLDADALALLLKRPGNPPDVQRVLELRDLVGSASVKKLFAIENMASRDDRLRNLMVHHGARTGRPTGEGAQPLNMPRGGPKLATCGCGKPYHPKHSACPWCGAPTNPGARTAWKPAMADPVLSIMAFRSLELVEFYFGDAVLAISGCLRSIFVAGEGMTLLASDYSAIEAVVTAMLAGEQWRIDAFRNGVSIYLASAAKITGNTLETYQAYKRDHGEDHPDRQKIGKVAELALGFGGWITAWRQFDDSDTFTDAEVKGHILAWREASPAIVELWGGQWRGKPWDGYAERYGFEGAAINAVQYRGTTFAHAGVTFCVESRARGGGAIADALIVTLLSGRQLTYHEPELTPATREWAAPGELQITYSTWNSNPKYGPLGWVRMSTYGSRLCENIVQAVAHDLLRFAILNLRAAGFPTVLHVYDEIIAEIPETTGEWALAEFERIMALVPWWAFGWPVKVEGGWRGRRYRKG